MPLFQIQTSNLDRIPKEDNNSNNNNKTRKRGCSSSSSSSLLRRYRFKRAILVGKSRTRSPAMATHQMQHVQLTKTKPLPTSDSGLPCKQEKELSVSARKLAATLWEINDLPRSRVEKKLEMRSCKEMIRSREKAVSMLRSGLLLRPQMSDPSHSPITERMKGFEGDCHKRRVSASSHHFQPADYYLGGLDDHGSASLIEQVENQPRNKNKCGKCKNRLKEARSGLSTSKKLLKVLNQMCLQEQHSSTVPLIMALGSELDRVCNQIDQLIQETSTNQNDIEYLMKHFAEEKAAWKRREREKIHDAIKHVAEELEVEKKLRRQTERLNKKIAKEMATVKASHLKASKELEREKRAKEIMEQICDELAGGIGEDRAQVEELRRESAKVREEMEKEREMLQLADVLREERVQMKLSEAKYQYEEKNAVLETLRNELEGFLRTKEEENGDDPPQVEKIKDLEYYLKKTCWGSENKERESDLNVAGDGVEHEGDDSDDSDLHSIELNMDNDNRSYKWSYDFEEVAQDNSKGVSADKESIGRKSISEKIQWGSICFNKGTTNYRKKDFGINIQANSDQSDPEVSIKFLSGTQIQDDKDETGSYMSANPALRNVQTSTLQYTGGEAEENALALEAYNLKQEATGKEIKC